MFLNLIMFSRVTTTPKAAKELYSTSKASDHYSKKIATSPQEQAKVIQPNSMPTLTATQNSALLRIALHS